MEQLQKSIPFWIIILCLLISLAGIGNHDLWTPDEPREAAIALQMSRSGKMIIPELAGKPFVEKPPLYYILTAKILVFLGAFLGRTAALRLASALFGLGTLGMTWLLVRRLLNGRLATFSMLILATTPGFMHVTHWILVDNALVFFVVAALWSFVEVYKGNRLGFLPLAGVFTALAFLSKGFIGPMIILPGWLALVIPWLRTQWSKCACKLRVFYMHIIAFLAFASIALWWLIAFRIQAGPELWHEWFWVNHFGRFTGNTVNLGHINGPFYYLGALFLYLLPWALIIVFGIVRLIVRICRHEVLRMPWLFLLCWGFGGLLLLSLSATKREIYLIVLLPAFAIMTALLLEELYSRWFQRVLYIWLLLLFIALGSLAVAPACGRAIRELAGNWNILNAIAAVGLFAGILILKQKKLTFLERWFAGASVAYISFFSVIFPAIDTVKSYQTAFCEMAQAIAVYPEEKVAAWNVDETTRAGFYYYCDLILPDLFDVFELESILRETDKQYTGAIVCSKRFPPEGKVLPPWKEVFHVSMGPTRALQLITGVPEN